MPNTITCCKDCEDRHKNCHSHCERYKAERAKLDQKKKAIREQQIVDGYFERCISEAYLRRNKKSILAERWHRKGKD
jgi:hypothetical protein